MTLAVTFSMDAILAQSMDALHAKMDINSVQTVPAGIQSQIVLLMTGFSRMENFSQFALNARPVTFMMWNAKNAKNARNPSTIAHAALLTSNKMTN